MQICLSRGVSFPNPDVDLLFDAQFDIGGISVLADVCPVAQDAGNWMVEERSLPLWQRRTSWRTSRCVDTTEQALRIRRANHLKTVTNTGMEPFTMDRLNCVGKCRLAYMPGFQGCYFSGASRQCLDQSPARDPVGGDHTLSNILAELQEIHSASRDC